MKLNLTPTWPLSTALRSVLSCFLTLQPFLQACRQCLIEACREKNQLNYHLCFSWWALQHCSTLVKTPTLIFSSAWDRQNITTLPSQIVFMEAISSLLYPHFNQDESSLTLHQSFFCLLKMFSITAAWWNVYYYNKWAAAFALLPFEELVK